ncbi:TetR/AcrR family transcriptional regulator [uncultured Ornithinimicrobium sp.]|uniref:TetR/AcrR family transcriptional regulator n=1 Tax=uncultured Ornithinimicrobium sp. TaxID=259307 RepID=UPI0025959A3E|nr:TetR/AcrR family transcriptional regulator [uncultured Ornithinimicrobium sp.]
MTTVGHPRRAPVPGVRDGRDVRWEAHRTERRRQLVEAALRAVRTHGAGVGMDEIATEAGTSKTVLYRHLGDRAGLYRAVVEAVDGRILADLAQARATGDDVVERIAAMVRSYLRLVEQDPEIYRFVMTRPLETTEVDPADPVHQLTDRIAEQLGAILREHLETVGHPDAATLAPLWGHMVVGMVRSASEHRLTRPVEDAQDAETLARAVVALLRPALTDTHP